MRLLLTPHRFCGTTTDFCTDECQSNCVEHPQPRGVKNYQDVRKRVIAYYEAWSARRACHPVDPSMLPISALTHVNFAFASIAPETFEITTMDTATPADLFQTAADVKTFKSGNSDLEVWISVGGWTFSDNDTVTQPLLGEISRDPVKREKFARNIVRFMDQYGFDGLDIDWEYPGAPDRGGKDDDTANYVLLVKKLREVFDARPRPLGLSITVPTSYWYLRWFDLPAMEPYLDWFNMMSYDLHGFWDRDNPIGSVVQGHTNLTEIKLAAELLWRVEIPPLKVVFGFGLYGRAFQLADPACSEPGCLFGSAALPGKCTDSAGILGYFEIMQLLQGQQALQVGAVVKRAVIEPVHDEAAAVKYFKYNHDQWVSYDDEATFKQKIDWANSEGFGGIMTWADDLDDIDHTGLSALLGRSVGSLAYSMQNPNEVKSVTQEWAGQNGQMCYRKGPCQKIDAMFCERGEHRAGYDRADCESGEGQPICCPVLATPRNCTWRGGPSEISPDCNGHCQVGEVKLFDDSGRGGGYHAETDESIECTVGKKAFCCVADAWNDLTQACEWSDCNGKCNAGFESIAQRYDPEVCSGYHQLCCPMPRVFEHCEWTGKENCQDNTCSDTQVELARDPYGDSTQSESCGAFRQKALCCDSPPTTDPFVPVPLEDLFPEPPPESDAVRYSIEYPKSSDGVEEDPSSSPAFGWVIIAGPHDAVTSAKVKRDGSPSDLRFVDCEKAHNKAHHTARFVCTSDSPSSDCDDMLDGGLDGTIIELPDGCGPAQHGVARSVYVASNQSLPEELSNISSKTVHELAFDHDFSLVKRDSGDIYFRVDYSNAGGKYWDLAVEAKPQQKRSLDRRFWSPDVSKWKDVLKTWFTDSNAASASSSTPSWKHNVFSSSVDCDSKQGFADIRADVELSGSSRMAATIIGTISPELKIDEAYVAMNSSLAAQLSLYHSISGKLYIPEMIQEIIPPVELDPFNHFGLVTLKPYIAADLAVWADIEMDGNFSTGTGTRTNYISQAWPGDAADVSSGEAYTDEWAGFQGKIGSLPPQEGDGKLKIEVFPRLGMEISLAQFDTNAKQLLVSADASLGLWSGVQIEKGPDPRFSVRFGSENTAGQLRYASGSKTIEPWESDGHDSRVIPDASTSKELAGGQAGFEKGEGPVTIDTDANEVAAFQNERATLSCTKEGAGDCQDQGVFCRASLCTQFPEYCNDDDSLGGVEDTGTTELELPNILAASRPYKVSLRGGPIQIWSRTYPGVTSLWSSGNNGVIKKRFKFLVDDKCSITSTIAEDFTTADIDKLGTNYVTEHILELQTIPTFLRAAIRGKLPSGQRLTTRLSPRFVRDNWNENVLSPSLPPVFAGGESFTSPNDRVFEALGSYDSRQNFVVTDKGINAVKARIWKLSDPRQSRFFNQAVFDWIYKCEDPQLFLQWMKATLGVFNYLNDPEVNLRLWDEARAVRAQLDLIEKNTNGGRGLTEAWDKYFP